METLKEPTAGPRFWIFWSLLLFALTAQAQNIDPALRAQLLSANLSPRAIDLIVARAKSQHYTKDSVAIVDYSLPSDQKRFFLINLKTQSFQTLPVSHALNSGGLFADSFSNTPNLLKSTLGFMTTHLHTGKFGSSLMLTGDSPSNTRLNVQRNILIHGAEYAGDTFTDQHGFRGRSYGCFAVPYEKIGEINRALGEGSMVLSYHDRLWDAAQTHPASQNLNPGHGTLAKKTDWEVQENLHGQQGGRIGTYQRRYGVSTAAAASAPTTVATDTSGAP